MNATQPSIELKEVATKVSELITAENKVDLSDYLEMLLQPNPENPLQQVPNQPMSDNQIGRWHKDPVSGDYVKNPSYDNDFHRWADQDVIKADKKDKFRIVYIGESVARGTHLPNQFIPAKVLERKINAFDTNKEVEIIDLARAGIGLVELIYLTKQSLHLNPDMIMIFAGNNWQPGISLCTPQNHAKLKKIGRTANQNMFIEENVNAKLAFDISNLGSALSEIQENLGIPVLYLLPDFNLNDWVTSKKENAIGFLPDQNIKQWHILKDACINAEKNKDWEEVSKIADAIIDLDTRHPFGYEKKASYYRVKEDKEMLRLFLQKAKDTAILNATEAIVPRRYAKVKELLLNEFETKKIEVLDVEDFFHSYLEGDIPDKKLFLDFCHLSVKGTDILMSDVAKRVVTKIEENSLVKESYSSITEIPANKEALSHFNAAIHNYYLGQYYSTIFYHCCRAIELADEQLLEAFKEFCYIFSRKTSPFLAKNTASFVSQNLFEHFSFLKYPRDSKLMYLEFVNALVSAFKTLKNIDIEEEIRQLRLEEYGIGNENVNLLEPVYSETDLQKYFCDVEFSFYRAHNDSSEFIVITDGKSDLNFDITARIPYKSACAVDDRIKVTINDKTVSDIGLSADWEKSNFIIEKETLTKGVNTIKIHWPIPEKKIQQKYYKSLFMPVDIINSLYFTFGEIFSFSVRTV